MTNLKPDAFVVVFGVNDEGPNAAASNEKVTAKLNDLMQKIKPFGSTSNDVFVDFITQNRVYDFAVAGTQATEKLTGFETKKSERPSRTWRAALGVGESRSRNMRASDTPRRRSSAREASPWITAKLDEVSCASGRPSRSPRVLRQ